MKLYEDLDELPIFNWYKIHETGDLRYLIISGKKPAKQKLKDHWKKLYEMYIKAFGFSEQFLKILEKEKELALLMIKKAETGNAVLQTFIEIKQHELSVKRNQVSKSDFYQIKSHMDKYMGFHADAKKMSVMEFFSNLKNIERENRKPTVH